MREILFKAKRKDNNEWVEGYLFKTPLTAEFNCDGQYFSSMVKRTCISNEDGCAFEVIPETICQYIGLTDKNGKKIFEGDIAIYEKKKCVISYWQQGFKYKIIDGDYLYYIGECLDNCEVIGNIFDEGVENE